MNTTALLVDILIIGIQVLIWLSGLVYSFVLNPKDSVVVLEKFTWLSILLILTTAYTMGIIFDYIIPWVLKGIESKIDKKHNKEETHKKFNVIDILNSNPETHEYLDNHFSRLRIARATLFNLPLITISLIVLMFAPKFCFSTELLIKSIVILLLGTILTLTAYKSWVYRKIVYRKYINRAYDLIEKKYD